MVKYAQKSQNFVWKLVLQKPRSRLKKICQKDYLLSNMNEFWVIFTENKLRVEKKNDKFKKLTSSLKFP